MQPDRPCRTRGCRGTAMPDSLDCRECMAEFLRRTRVAFVPEWRRRAAAGLGFAKDLTRAA